LRRQPELPKVGGVIQRCRLRHAFFLNSQHHDDVCARDAVLDSNETLRAAKFGFLGQQRRRRHQAKIRGPQSA
jgi:hypothetical protein